MVAKSRLSRANSRADLLVYGLLLLAMPQLVPVTVQSFWLAVLGVTGYGAWSLARDYYSRAKQRPWQIHCCVLGQVLCICLSAIFPANRIALSIIAAIFGCGSIAYARTNDSNINTSLLIMIAWVASAISLLTSPVLGLSRHLFLHDIFLVVWAQSQGGPSVNSCCACRRNKTNFLSIAVTSATLLSTSWLLLGMSGQALLSFMSVIVGVCPCVTEAGLSLLRASGFSSDPSVQQAMKRQDRVSRFYTLAILVLSSGLLPNRGVGRLLNKPLSAVALMRVVSLYQVRSAKTVIKEIEKKDLSSNARGC
ncbi:MAG: hypothetical protein CMF46_05360 [Legionellales bacterium]|nr:hypothetical protein [Legionellales bacterium]